jgi:hypothetical protein
MNDMVGRDDLLLLALDALRYDAAQEAWRAGAAPKLAQWLPASGWGERHTPGTFTYAARDLPRRIPAHAGPAWASWHATDQGIPRRGGKCSRTM